MKTKKTRVIHVPWPVDDMPAEGSGGYTILRCVVPTEAADVIVRSPLFSPFHSDLCITRVVGSYAHAKTAHKAVASDRALCGCLEKLGLAATYFVIFG